MSCQGCAATVVASALGSLKDVEVLKIADFRPTKRSDELRRIDFDEKGNMRLETWGYSDQAHHSGVGLDLDSLNRSDDAYRAILIVVRVEK